MRLMLIVLLVLFVTGCVRQESRTGALTKKRPAVIGTGEDVRKLLEAEANQDQVNFPRIELEPVDGYPGCFAVLYDTQAHWWGRAGVCSAIDGQICWYGEINYEREQSNYSIRCLRLAGQSDPIIELVGQTHCGNGFLYLAAFDGTKTRLVLQTRALDFYHDNMILEEPGVLNRHYLDFNGDGFDDVLLTGYALWLDGDCEDDNGVGPFGGWDCRWQHRELVRKAFVFNPASGVFDEVVTWRLGPDLYHD